MKTKYKEFKCSVCKSKLWFEIDDEGNIYRWYSRNAVNCDECSKAVINMIKRGSINVNSK